MKKSELQQIIKEEISNVLGEGRKPGPKEQKRRETYQIAGKYLSDNPEYKSFSYDEDTDEFHFYTTDWSVSSSTPSETISRELLSGKTLNEEDPLQTAFNKKVGTSEPSGAKNVMRSKEWMEGKRAYLKGEPSNKQLKNPYTGKKATEWTLGMNAAFKLDPKPHNVDSKMDVSSYYKEKGSGGYTGD
jgi:hypothetical protein